MCCCSLVTSTSCCWPIPVPAPPPDRAVAVGQEPGCVWRGLCRPTKCSTSAAWLLCVVCGIGNCALRIRHRGRFPAPGADFEKLGDGPQFSRDWSRRCQCWEPLSDRHWARTATARPQFSDCRAHGDLPTHTDGTLFIISPHH